VFSILPETPGDYIPLQSKEDMRRGSTGQTGIALDVRSCFQAIMMPESRKTTGIRASVKLTGDYVED
jgi:hypothetical protein